MKISRRGIMAGGVLGALAIPAVTGLSGRQWKAGASSVLLHDNSLNAGRRFAQAGRAAGGRTAAIEGDAVRFAQSVLADSPAMIAGISRHAEALLIGEVAMEAGYALATEMHGRADGCECFTTAPGWIALNRLAVGAGSGWVEALAQWAIDPQASDSSPFRNPSTSANLDPGTVLGWVLVPRG